MAINDVSSIKLKDDNSPANAPTEELENQVNKGVGSKKKKIVLFAGFGIFLFVLTVTGIILYNKKKTREAAVAKQEEMALLKTNPIFTDLDEMIVNLDTRGKGINFLKIKITLEVQDQQSLAVISKMMPKIKDTFQLYLRELRPSDLYGSISLYRLRDELLIRINKILYPAKVTDILFKDVLIQ